MIKGFLLDIDGTLLDSNEAHAKAWSYAFKHFGYAVTTDEVRILIGIGGDRLLSTLVPELTINEGKGKEISEFMKQYFLGYIAQDLKPTAGARNLLLELKRRNIMFVVATSASSEELDILLQKAEIDDLINEVTTASDVKHSKPAPDVIAVAFKKMQLPTEEVVMLGDTPYDIAAAKKVGIKTIALRSGGFSDEHLKGALYIYDNPKEVLQHLDFILKEKVHLSHAPLRAM